MWASRIGQRPLEHAVATIGDDRRAADRGDGPGAGLVMPLTLCQFHCQLSIAK